MFYQHRDALLEVDGKYFGGANVKVTFVRYLTCSQYDYCVHLRVPNREEMPMRESTHKRSSMKWKTRNN
jgi:hypothetical protein